MDDNKGLTIVELIVVIGFLGLLFSIAIPKVDRTPYLLVSASKALRNNIVEVRYSAMTEGTLKRVFFNKYAYKIIESTKTLKSVDMRPGIKIIQNFKNNDLAFHYNGTPLFGGGTIIILDEITKRYCEITVVPATGRILMKDEVFKGYAGVL